MTCAIGLWISLPGAPEASTSGISAKPAVSAVIRIGSMRSCEPRRTASGSDRPAFSRRW